MLAMGIAKAGRKSVSEQKVTYLMEVTWRAFSWRVFECAFQISALRARRA
jgi:hypothetical protein